MRKACRPFGPGSTSQTTRDAFIGGLIAVAAQTGDVQQHVGHAVVGNDEAVALGDIEPFDDAGYLDDVRRRIAGESDVGSEPRLRWILVRSRPTP